MQRPDSGGTSYLARLRRLPHRQLAMLGALALAVIAANIRQPFPEIAPLQHIPTVILLLAAPMLLDRFRLSDRSVLALTGFFLLHTLAGRYTYSNVPYDDWARALTGHDISGTFGMARNDFDRVVHFSFGLLWVGPFAELVRRHAGMSRKAAIWMAFLFVGAVSALYEVFEWLLTMMVASDLAADYNGQQGDPWDSQKDMAMAIVGAAIAGMWLWRHGERG